MSIPAKDLEGILDEIDAKVRRGEELDSWEDRVWAQHATYGGCRACAATAFATADAS